MFNPAGDLVPPSCEEKLTYTDLIGQLLFLYINSLRKNLRYSFQNNYTFFRNYKITVILYAYNIIILDAHIYVYFSSTCWVHRWMANSYDSSDNSTR